MTSPSPARSKTTPSSGKLTASVLTEVCHDVRVEPDLQPITNETLSAATANTSEGARLDIAMNGFWGGRFEKTFVDVRVFNPYAHPTVTQQSPHATKNMKTRRKGHTIKELERWSMQRLHPSFFQLPVVYRGRQLFFYKRLASLLSSKTNQPYSQTMNWLRCRLSFALLRSAIQCIRGAISSQGRAITTPQIDLATSESTLCH